MIEVFTKSELEEIKKEFKDNYIAILESYQYGNFSLSIWQDEDGVMLSLVSDDGHVNSYISRAEFRDLLNVENGLEKYLNEMLYYNFAEDEEGEEQNES